MFALYIYYKNSKTFLKSIIDFERKMFDYLTKNYLLLDSRNENNVRIIIFIISQT